MSERKNITRNARRPKSSQQGRVAAVGSRSNNDDKIQEELQKLDEWRALNK